MIDFTPFRKRVRLLRTLAWLAFGLIAGGLIGGLLVAAIGWHWVEWNLRSPLGVGLAILVGFGALGGAFGFTRPSEDVDLAKSLDVRASTQDRLATATLVHEGDLNEALSRDALATASRISPTRAYPFKAGPWHFTALASCALPLLAYFSVFVPGMINPENAREREEVKSKAGEVERVAAEVEAATKSDQTPQSKALSQALRKLSQDMKAERVDKQEQSQRANELKKLANDLARAKADQAQQNLTTAREAQRKISKEQAMNRELTDHQKAVLAMSVQEREDAARKIDAQMEANNRQIEAAQTELKSKPMSPQERAQAEKKVEEQIKKQEELQNMLKDLRMDPKTLENLAKAMNDPANEELKKLAEQMQQKMSEAQKKAAMQQLTKEDLDKMKEQFKQMKQQLEQLEKDLKDPAKSQAMVQAMKEAMKNADQMTDAAAKAMSLMESMGQGQGQGQGDDKTGKDGSGNDAQNPSTGGNDLMTHDTGHIDTYDKPQAEVGKTETKAVTGNRQDKGEESYMEVKGPAELNGKTSVPTQTISPSAARKAEQSIARGRIPAKHTDRVRTYFESLSRPGK